MKKLIAFAIVAASIGLNAGCADREAQKQAKRTEAIAADPTKPIVVDQAISQDVTESIDVTGEITTFQDVPVGAKVSGRLVAVYVREGDPVKAGQTLAIQDTSTLNSQMQQALAQVAAARAGLNQALTNARIAPSKSRSAVAAAEAGLRSAKAQLQKARDGARDEEVKQAEASVRAAKAQMDTAKKDVDRKRKLFGEGAISQQVLDVAESAYQGALANYESALEMVRMRQSWTRPEDIASAQEAVRQAEENLRTARANQRLDAIYNEQVQGARANLQAAMAQVNVIRTQIADAVIRAPFSGRIAGQPVQPGAVLGPGAPVVRMVGLEGSYFEGEVPENQISRIRPGMPVSVKIDALSDIPYTGVVGAINPTATNFGRLFKVRIQLNANSGLIKPGMFARGAIAIRTIPNVVTVPSDAIVRRAGKAYVFVREGEKAKRLEVKLGQKDGERQQVDGVPAGAEVVIRGQSDLEEGVKVKVETQTENAKNEKPS